MLTLPFPPSANRIWRNVYGRTLKSESYRVWMRAAIGAIAIGRPTVVSGPFHVSILADRPDKRRRDLDNLAKPILDALKCAAVIDDDHLAQSISLSWSDRAPAKPGAVRVQVEPV